MRPLFGVLVALVVIAAPAAQTADDVLSDTRLSVHTLVREDVFAGWRSDNMPRLERAERNIEVLLKQRPDQWPRLTAWKSGTEVYRAVLAHEAGQAEAFTRLYDAALAGFARAASATANKGGVAAITGGTMALFADRLPEDKRAAAWELAYQNYGKLWKEQEADIATMPSHFKGEVLSGMTQAAQRTGRTEEAAQFLDRMLVLLADTPYASLAQQWKATPSIAATTNLTCRNCHTPGKLENRVAELKAKGQAD